MQGRYEHVNFTWEPAPVQILVIEVVPPEPPKLLAIAGHVVAFDEDLPPVEVVPELVDIRRLTANHPAHAYLLPCHGSGVQVAGELAFLDTRPAERLDWVMIGCERSLQFHRHFYEPPRVDLCPRKTWDLSIPTLAKCCLLERGVEF